MSSSFAQIPPLRALAAFDVASLVPLALVAWAAWELRGARPAWLDARQRRLAVGFGIAVLGLHLLLALAVAVTAWAVDPTTDAGARLLTNLNLVLSVGIFQSLAGGVLLAVTLALGDRPFGRRTASSRVSELLPWLLPMHDEVPARRRALGGTVAESAAWLAAALVYSAAWMALARHLAGAHTAPQVQTDLQEPGGGISVTSVVASLGLVVLAPLFEEVAFRGFLLDRLRGLFARWIGRRRAAGLPGMARHRADAVAVVVTAAVWALAHAGRMEPEWVKWVQIFGLGLVLGVLRLRRGLEACVVVHLLFNVPGGFLFAAGP